MEPGSRVELPPRGADLSFLSSNPEADTPSRWLAFNTTPGGANGGGGNTTPGTAFGSPFWGSLIGANNGLGTGGAQSTSNLTPGGGQQHHGGGGGANGQHGASAAAGGGHSSRLSPKNFSPSKEFNPFELSFFPKHNEHLLNNNNKANSGKEDGNNRDAASDTQQQRNGRNSLSNSVSSLKRPFQEAHGEEDGDDDHTTSNPLSASAPAHNTLQSDASARNTAHMDDSSLSHSHSHSAAPWQKRAKIEEFNSAPPPPPYSSDLSSSISAPSSMYAPSPSATLNLNASPDSGMSPASSAMIPTPSLQHAMLPPNTTVGGGAAAVFNGAMQQRKSSISPEQFEAAKLGGSVNGVNNAPSAIPLHPHQQPQHLYNVQQQQQQQSGLMTQSVPPPLSAGFNSSHHHQPGGHPFSYTGYVAQQSQSQSQQPVILPPKTLQQAQAAQQQQHQSQQRTMSPVTSSNPPQSARQESMEDNSGRQDSPANTASATAPNPIPYANGRGPSASRPARSTRSSHNKRGTSAALANGGGNSTNDEQSFVKEEEDANMYDSSSGGGNVSFSNSNSNTQNNATTTTTSSTAKTATTKGGKKGKKQGGRAGSTGASNSNNNNNNSKSTTTTTSNAAPAFQTYAEFTAANSAGLTGDGGAGGDEDDEGGDDEHKRKAFLERNRQAACRSRQKKKEWINNLETHATRLQTENQSLAAEIELLRKELFALRHTLSFHERSGCTGNHSAGGAQQQQQQQHSAPMQAAPLPSATLQQQQQAPPPVLVQQQQRPEWRQQQQAQPSQQQQQQQTYQQQHAVQGPAIVQTHPSPQPHHAPLQPAPPVHIQTQPQPINARLNSGSGAGPTLAPSALQGMSMPIAQQRPSSAMQDHQQQQLSASQLRAPPKLNLSPASLQPQQQQQQAQQQQHHHQTGMNSLAPQNHHQFPPHGSQLGHPSDINRPGSAGATFGLSTPNFADLFNGAMGKLGGGGDTPFLGAGLLFTPGGIMSSGGMLGGIYGSSSNNGLGYNMSPGLPNTFGLSMQDIPIRPASAPPTPSPALDTRLGAPSQDYFSSKNLSSSLGTSAAFADFLAAYNPTNLQAGSVLA